MSEVSRTHGQRRSNNVKWKIPKLDNSSVSQKARGAGERDWGKRAEVSRPLAGVPPGPASAHRGRGPRRWPRSRHFSGQLDSLREVRAVLEFAPASVYLGAAQERSSSDAGSAGVPRRSPKCFRSAKRRVQFLTVFCERETTFT